MEPDLKKTTATLLDIQIKRFTQYLIWYKDRRCSKDHTLGNFEQHKRALTEILTLLEKPDVDTGSQAS